MVYIRIPEDYRPSDTLVPIILITGSKYRIMAASRPVYAIPRSRISKIPLPELFLAMESLVYEKDDATLRQVERLAEAYLKQLRELPKDQLASREGQAKQMRSAFSYLAKFKVIPADFSPKKGIEQLIREQGWDEKK